ncbi:MAG: hypothetical protein LAO56_13245 [Acidobacteriia bacterium]|nr:hypothetical protein [Terriglobia bacterium]
MTPERWQQIWAVYDHALALKGDGQAAYLDEACVSDHKLRQEVESLLRSENRVASEFLQTPAADLLQPLPRERKYLPA